MFWPGFPRKQSLHNFSDCGLSPNPPSLLPAKRKGSHFHSNWVEMEVWKEKWAPLIWINCISRKRGARFEGPQIPFPTLSTACSFSGSSNAKGLWGRRSCREGTEMPLLRPGLLGAPGVIARCRWGGPWSWPSLALPSSERAQAQEGRGGAGHCLDWVCEVLSAKWGVVPDWVCV